MIEKIADGVVRMMTLNNFGVGINPTFLEVMESAKKEKRNFASRFYDFGTMVIIDDIQYRIIPRLELRKRQ